MKSGSKFAHLYKTIPEGEREEFEHKYPFSSSKKKDDISVNKK